LEAGWIPLGLCASDASAARLSAGPFPAKAIDISRPIPVPAGWENPDLLIHCASSGRGGADAYRSVYREGLRNLLEAFRPARVIFTGSTSVYAQADGSWVTEESPAQPERETGKVLLEAEALALAAGGIVARLSGLYGPGRSVILQRMVDGTAVLEELGDRWVNQIHRDDAASALLHLADASVAGGIYNVSDNSPTRQRDIYQWLALALDKPMPPDGPANPNRKRGITNKRVCNAKLVKTGWSPAFPTFKDAIPSLLEAAGI